MTKKNIIKMILDFHGFTVNQVIESWKHEDGYPGNGWTVKANHENLPDSIRIEEESYSFALEELFKDIHSIDELEIKYINKDDFSSLYK